MKVTFLEAKVPLTKTFELKAGVLQKIGHPKIVDYWSHEEECANLEEFYHAVTKHATLNHCLLKGNLTRALKWESRKGTTDPNAPTWMACLDLDGVKVADTPGDFMKLAGMGDVDYVLQYSASSGVVKNRGLSCHIFPILDKSITPAMLKQILMHLNLTIPGLRAGINLTRTNNALRWPLDISTCQNDKLIYIAPPILGKGVKDEFVGERIQLVKGTRRTLKLDIPANAERNKVEAEKVLNALRKGAGLPERKKTVYHREGAVEYMAKPDVATVTGMRKERGFVYFNLNGGDSWAYFHSENNPEFIHNFKGEPAYKTSELLPDYWQEVRGELSTPKPDENGVLYLAFRQFKSASYFNGRYFTKEDRVELAPAKSERQIQHFLRQYGQPVPDIIPDWDMVYDPHGDKRCSVEDRQVNLYVPPEFATRKLEVVTKLPDVVTELLLHMVGGNEPFLDHFVNWVACIVKHRVRCETGMVFHGVQGTGKGLTLDALLRPAIGYGNVVAKRMSELESEFNGWMERTQLLWVDEAHMAAFTGSAKMDANVKNFITEKRISIRNMYMQPYEANNWLNIIFASNKNEPVLIDPNDRRFNVAYFQSHKLAMSDKQVAEIYRSAWPFYCYLMQYDADIERARKPLHTGAKETMIEMSMSSIDHVTKAIRDGDIEFFRNQLPHGDLNMLPQRIHAAAVQYIALVEALPSMTCLTREEIFVLANYVVGHQPAEPAKFTQLLGHHGLKMKPVYRDGKTIRGHAVKWSTP